MCNFVEYFDDDSIQPPPQNAFHLNLSIYTVCITHTLSAHEAAACLKKNIIRWMFELSYAHHSRSKAPKLESVVVITIKTTIRCHISIWELSLKYSNNSLHFIHVGQSIHHFDSVLRRLAQRTPLFIVTIYPTVCYHFVCMRAWNVLFGIFVFLVKYVTASKRKFKLLFSTAIPYSSMVWFSIEP